MGKMRLDFPAGGWAAEDAKNVADTVAVRTSLSQHRAFSNVDQNDPEANTRTRILAVQPGFKQIVELEDEFSGLREERDVSSGIFEVRPYDTIPASGLGRRCSPNCQRVTLIEG